MAEMIICKNVLFKEPHGKRLLIEAEDQKLALVAFAATGERVYFPLTLLDARALARYLTEFADELEPPTPPVTARCSSNFPWPSQANQED